jgi:hypothetical protein
VECPGSTDTGLEGDMSEKLEITLGCFGVLLAILLGVLAFAWVIVLPVIGLLWVFGGLN